MNKIKMFFLGLKLLKHLKKIQEAFMDKKENKLTQRELIILVLTKVIVIFSALQGWIPHNISVYIISGLAALYTICRTVAKITPTKKDDEWVAMFGKVLKDNSLIK